MYMKKIARNAAGGQSSFERGFYDELCKLGFIGTTVNAMAAKHQTSQIKANMQPGPANAPAPRIGTTVNDMAAKHQTSQIKAFMQPGLVNDMAAKHQTSQIKANMQPGLANAPAPRIKNPVASMGVRG